MINNLVELRAAAAMALALAKPCRWRSLAILASCAALPVAGCSPAGAPPPSLTFEGLPVSGNLKDAARAGFGRCAEIALELRCRREDVMFIGQGPFSAALDLAGSDGAGGFRQLTLWHDRNQNAVFAITRVLQQQGWRYCYTGGENWGDQAIYTREGVPFFISMDLSYWGKRRLRVLPRSSYRTVVCTAKSGVERP